MRSIRLPGFKNPAKTFLLILSVLILSASLLSCRKLLEKLNDKAFPGERVVANTSKNIQFTIPKGWREDKNLKEDADLTASNRLQENYIIVLSENKADFDEMTAAKHSKITSNAIVSKLQKAEISPRKKVQINGKKAYQYVIHGVLENIKLTYLHTTIDGTGYYHQIMAWTLKSRFAENEAVLRKVTDSFQETGKKDAEE